METWGRLLQDATMPQQMALETTNQNGNFTVELLGSSEDSKFGNRDFFAKNNVNHPSLIHNSNIDSDVRAGL